MLNCKDEVEIRELVTFYTIYTCIYFPILLLFLTWSDWIYSAGKYEFHSILTIIAVVEMTKYFISAIRFKINDVNLCRRHEDKSLFIVIRSMFARARIKEGFKTIICVAIMILVYFVISVLYGAEVFNKHEETFMFSSLLSVLTIFPICMNLGSHSLILFLFGSKPHDKLEMLMYQNLYFTILGAWLGAFVIPLDWDRPWQEWPISCSFGAMIGFLFSHVAMTFQIRQGPKKKFKKFNQE